MESRILRPVISEEELFALFSRLHFNKEDYPDMCQVYAAVRRTVSACAWFGCPDKQNRTACIVTLGAGVDELEEQYQLAGELLKAYQLQCISGELLRKCYEELSLFFQGRFGQEIGAYLFPGEELPLSWNGQILSQSGQKTVTCNQAYMLKPKKSVVFLAQLSGKGRKRAGSICENCNNTDCTERRTGLE